MEKGDQGVSRHLVRNAHQFNSGLAASLDELEQHYGVQHPACPTDPYLFLVWWHCGYPASDASCAKGWEALKRTAGTDPERILATEDGVLVSALKSGGMVPEVRAERLKEIAHRVLEEFGGDLKAALHAMPVAKARGVLKSFPGIADPGADRILLFAGIAPIAAAPSSSPQVVLRMQTGHVDDSYSRNYKQAQEIIEASIAPTFEARTRAFLILKRHGEQICKRSTPHCHECPIAGSCAFTR
jgi:endonuclease III